jgi:diacylglycerol kinase (ATP)
VRATVEVDGKRFFKGKVSCVLTANVGKILGGVEAFPQAQPDDGRLELGVVTARNPVQWARTFGRLALGHPEQSRYLIHQLLSHDQAASPCGAAVPV